MDLAKSLAENLKGVSLVENPVLHVVRQEEYLDHLYPLVGPTPVQTVPKNRKKVEKSSATLMEVVEDDDSDAPSDSKKTKLTFYDVSDGELSDSS